MAEVSQKLTMDGLLRRTTRRLARARLHYGHGTECAADDAAALLAHVSGARLPLASTFLRRAAGPRLVARLEPLIERRIRERVPVVYLTQRCWFAGLPMYVDERVLIPRSPFAELIEQRFEPWVDPSRVRSICDMGTGSGCIAIACAYAFPAARVDAVDIEPGALAVARRNVAAHGLRGRVRLRRSDHFAGLGKSVYDMIVSNPPYVGARELAGLPAEYRHEPRLALAAGRDGMHSVDELLLRAPRHLRPGGLLVVEVGNTEHVVRRRYPRLPFTWLQFRRGGGGLFALTREQLLQGRGAAGGRSGK